MATIRLYLVLLLAVTGLSLVSCEKTPTDYGVDPIIATAPLKTVVLKDAVQTVSINGSNYADFKITDGNLLEADSLFTISGHIDQVNGKKTITLTLDFQFPDTGVNALIGFREPQLRGFTLEMD